MVAGGRDIRGEEGVGAEREGDREQRGYWGQGYLLKGAGGEP